MNREVTYADGLIRPILLLMDVVRVSSIDKDIVINFGDSLFLAASFRIVNIGKSDKGRLLDFIDEIKIFPIEE